MDTTRYACGECDFAYKSRTYAELCHPFVGGVYVVDESCVKPCVGCQRNLVIQTHRDKREEHECAACWLRRVHGE